MGCVCRRGLTRGLVSRPFPAAALPRAAAAAAAAAALQPRAVFVDVDGAGFLCGAGGAGGEEVAVRARLAPHVHGAHLVLTGGERGGVGEVRLRCERAAAPHQDLLLWFDDDLRARIHMPFLTLRNIHGGEGYACSECGARFEEPNPLKMHLFLRCAPLTGTAFWRAVAARLQGAAPSLPLTCAPLHAADAWAARLEVAAAEWGRARGGHACLYCGKLYSRKYGLKIHLRTHTGYRPLRCRHCARAFGDPSNLNKHVRLHAAGGAGGQHACPRCGKGLARRRDLDRHLRAHCAPAAPLAPPLVDVTRAPC